MEKSEVEGAGLRGGAGGVEWGIVNVVHSSGKRSEKQVAPSPADGKALTRRRIVTFLVLTVIALGVGYGLRSYYLGFVREVVTNVVPFFFTPFILEATTFFVGLTVVLMWNNYHRQKDEEDEWVYLSQVDPETAMEQIPESLRKRAGETRFRESDHPELRAGASVALDRIEGYIALGLCDEATGELLQLSETVGDVHPEILRLRYLLCAKAKGAETARALAGEWISRGLVDAETVALWEG